MNRNARCLLGIVLLLFSLGHALAQDTEEVTLTTSQVADGIYMISGRGGNITFSVGDDGVVMIDDNYAPLTPAVLNAVASVTDQPVRLILNTHYHADHTGGNENFGESGAVVVAHDNVRRRMSVELLRDWFGEVDTIEASPPGGLPIMTFDSTVSFHLNGQDIFVFHVENAHTDGDSVVHYRTANVVHTGDVVFYGLYPYIDVMNGGSVKGTITAVDQIIELVDENTKVIPGHGTLTDAAGLREYRDVLATIVGRIEALMAEGKTEAEVLAAQPSAEFDAKWGRALLRRKSGYRQFIATSVAISDR
ncbi:MAG: MBL fold metallo-hydrolase [Gammaproteobacteria bacterium]